MKTSTNTNPPGPTCKQPGPLNSQNLRNAGAKPRRWPREFLHATTFWRAALTLFVAAFLLSAKAGDPNLDPAFPADTNASLGATVSMRVIASTTLPPLMYQWQHEQTNLLGATTYLLTLRNLTLADAGRYQVVVTNASGDFATSRVATLTVDPTFTKITQGRHVTDLEGSVGVTWIDYDQDGYLDLFIGNTGSGPGGGDPYNSLYHNNGDGAFLKITTNLLGATPGQAWGLAWGDYDNDGRPDLYVANTSSRRPALFHNEGEGKFSRITTGVLVRDALDSTGAFWGDYDNDGFIDLFVPNGFWNGTQNDRLYHNEGNGEFRIMTAAELGPLVNDSAQNYAFGWIDYDNDGDLVYLSNTPCQTALPAATLCSATHRPADSRRWRSPTSTLPA